MSLNIELNDFYITALNKDTLCMAFVSFRFCDMIVDRDVFIAVCFLLRATCAIGGAATETSTVSILLTKFPDNVGMVSVCGIFFS